jgi:hypothetical protein
MPRRWQIQTAPDRSGGHFYNQLTADSGCLPALCPFESRTVGLGPQIGFIMPNASFHLRERGGLLGYRHAESSFGRERMAGDRLLAERAKHSSVSVHGDQGAAA